MTKRTINEVLDCETGEPIDANEFFLKPFDELINFRSELQRAIKNYREPLFTCYYCRQKIRIRGGTGFSSTRKKESFHFAHLKDSDECPIKTNNTLSKAEVDRIKYNGAKESNLHRKLKENIAEGLRRNAESRGEVSNVEVERTISDKISKDWKKPDINALFFDKRIAIEIQLSTTWLDVITERQHFYSENGIFIFWVFPQFEAEDDIRKLTYSDVVYTNNQNAYIFDSDCYNQSVMQGNLVLKCFYKRYTREEITIYEHWEETYITLSDLTFNTESLKIYYHDSSKEKANLEKELEAIKKRNRKIERKKEEEEGKKRDKLAEYDKKAKPLINEIDGLSLRIRSLLEYEKGILNDIEEKRKDLDNLDNLTEKTMRYINGYLFPPFSDNYELLESLTEKYKAILAKSNILDSPINEEIKTAETRLNLLNRIPIIEIGSVKYRNIDKTSNWKYIKSNYTAFRIIHKDVVDSLFAEAELREISNTQELDRLQYSKDFLFLMDFEEEIKQLKALILVKRENLIAGENEAILAKAEIQIEIKKHFEQRIDRAKNNLTAHQSEQKAEEKKLISKQEKLNELKNEYNID